MAKKGDQHRVLAAKNKKALRDFFILDNFEAGIVLKGSEVKSIREHKINLKDSFARVRDGQLLLYNVHISPYDKARIEEIDPVRTRKLLMHRKEIDRLAGKLTDKSLTLVPLEVYFKDNRVKVELALAKGKVKRDKRRDIQEREMKREINRALKYK
ncbi:MAG: SsrA-binding protein SmpB [Actinomycetota bacterium]|jgi:SsrA-binding protein|nr:SsrA-binding protein SmpB [Actinomycetota bacterium]